MNTSQQATGRNFPRDGNYPFRCIVRAEHDDGFWTVQAIFEWETFEGADVAGRDVCTEPFSPGIVSMHYYVGEVA